MIDEALTRWLQQQLGVTPCNTRAVGGGCIHAAWRVELSDGRRLFLKTNAAAALPLLASEAEGLLALADVAPVGLQLPVPLAWGVVGTQAVLLMSWLELGRASSEAAWSQLGQALAMLHRNSLEQGPGLGSYGWQQSNFIGATPQPNGWHAQWSAFFCKQRLGHQLGLAEASGQGYRGAQRLLELLPRWLEPHAPEPVLVHGDLWGGNASALQGGAWAVFDPAVYRGDREVDLAMARLFGGFPDAFFSGYALQWPLPAGWAQRVELYNLYHLLNHAHMFGGGYGQQAQASIDALLQLPL